MNNHELRQVLNDEAHARPSPPLPAPCRLCYVVRTYEAASWRAEWRLLVDLLESFGQRPPKEDAKHCIADLGDMRLRWERHTEFSRYLFISDADNEPNFDDVTFKHLPREWLDRLLVNVIVATRICVIVDHEPRYSVDEFAARYFDDNILVGSQIAGGAGMSLTDFQIREDGFMRQLLINDAMSDEQTALVLQRLLEVDSYRLMTLLALPLAQQLAPFLSRSEDKLTQISAQLIELPDNEEEDTLQHLTRLLAEVENRQAMSEFRFGAAEAYYELVKRRIDELREVRIGGIQTYKEFTKRRLTPAVYTCRSIAGRARSLAQRAGRTARLLSTRVGITRQQQNQILLQSMNRRARMQLRLQQTVEGLSVAALTYYVSGLVGYLAAGAKAAGLPVNSDIAKAISIPIFAVFAFWGVYKMRRHLDNEGENNGGS